VAGFASEAAALPLIAGGRCLGVLGLVFADRERTPEERAVVQSLGQQCAQALERGRLYDRERRATEVLQRSLLPGRLAAIPGLDVSAFYAPSGEGGRVGGDFYDVYEVAGGGWGAVVGDVCGKGAEAAGVTMLARQALRAQADVGLGPAASLGRLNSVLLSGGRRVLTAADMRLRIADGRMHVTLSLAGHPPPLLVPVSGEVRPLGRYGNLLGFLPEPRLHETSLVLGEGDVLVLYTDGVTEARSRGVEFGQGRLLEVLEASRGLGAREIGNRVLNAVAAHVGGPAPDDIALLVMRHLR
jgi:serine phosphatase RsbU (regulator of sigma subunit)